MGLTRCVGVLSLSFCILAGAGAADAKSKTKIKPFSPYVGQQAMLVMTYPEGVKLQGKNENALCHPASLTKAATAAMVYELLAQKKITLDKQIDVSAHAESMPRTNLGLKKGMKITIGDALKALFIVSANDAAAALAEFVASDEAEFARQMTKFVQSHGMKDTVFRNASGLPDPEQVTTAHDMALLLSFIVRNYPQYLDLMNQTEFTFGGKTYKGHSHFLEDVPGAEIAKTGFTFASFNNLLVSVKRGENGPRLIGVVMGVHGAKKASALLAERIDEWYQIASVARVPAHKSGAIALNP